MEDSQDFIPTKRKTSLHRVIRTPISKALISPPVLQTICRNGGPDRGKKRRSKEKGHARTSLRVCIVKIEGMGVP